MSMRPRCGNVCPGRRRPGLCAQRGGREEGEGPRGTPCGASSPAPARGPGVATPARPPLAELSPSPTRPARVSPEARARVCRGGELRGYLDARWKRRARRTRPAGDPDCGRLRAPCGRGGRGGRGTLRGGEARRGCGQAHRGPLTAWRRAPPRARARPLRQPELTATTHPPFFVAPGTSGGAEGGHLSLRACPAPPCQTQSPRLSGLPGADLGDLRDVPLGSPPV